VCVCVQLVTLIETGLRLGDACLLDFDCIMVDSAGWPCLRYHNSKVTTECLVPLSERAATTISAQQIHVRSRFPAGSPLLFPRERANPDGARPYVTTTMSARLRAWCQATDLRDQTGKSITVTAHRFRHTLGTRMKISDVAATASLDMVRDQGPIRDLGFSAVSSAG
jgi:integrase